MELANLVQIIFLLGIALILHIISQRVEGDETVGFGSQFLIGDGPGGAEDYVVVPKVESLGVPNEVTGIVESKRLDLTDGVIVKLATLKNGGSFVVKIQLTAATYSRLETHRKAKTKLNFKVKVTCDTGFVEKIVPGIITQNPLEDIESEKITVINCNIEVVGAQLP